jgi:hypothetical protein
MTTTTTTTGATPPSVTPSCRARLSQSRYLRVPCSWLRPLPRPALPQLMNGRSCWRTGGACCHRMRRAANLAELGSSPGGLDAQVNVGMRRHLKRRRSELVFTERGWSPTAMMEGLAAQNRRRTGLRCPRETRHACQFNPQYWAGASTAADR